jgi:hypothetical protein
MKVKINGKIFTAKQVEINNIKKLRIKRDLDDFDILFFKEWMMMKTDYKEDIPFISKLSRGKLIDCFPCDLGENYVLLVHNDIKEI